MARLSGQGNSGACRRIFPSVSNVKNFESATFEQQVLESPLPVLVDFSAEWCPPCKALAPVVDRLAAEYSERMLFGTIDVDEHPDIAGRYGVMGMPTLALFKDGRLVDRQVGYAGDSRLREFVARHLAAQL